MVGSDGCTGPLLPAMRPAGYGRIGGLIIKLGGSSVRAFVSGGNGEVAVLVCWELVFWMVAFS